MHRERGAARARRGSVALLAVVLASLGPGAVGVTGPVKVVGGPEDQLHPSVNGTYLIWTQNSEASPHVDHAYGRALGTDGRFRLDASGTRGAAGGIDPGSDRAIYQQMTDTTSDLFWFDLVTRERFKVAAEGVNTNKWERDPRVSDGYLFFARDTAETTSLFLFDRTADTLDKIASYDFLRFYVAPGAVGDRYATWTVCGPFTCTAWWYDTQAADPKPKKITSVEGRPQYAPVIDEASTYVYFVRSGQACGASVGVWRRHWPLDPDVPAERLVLLPAGIDTGWTMSLDHNVDPVRVDLWFSRFRCGANQGDVYELRDVETGP